MLCRRTECRRKHAGCQHPGLPAVQPPTLGDGLALELSLGHVLLHRLVQREIGRQPFQPNVLLIKYLQALNLERHQGAIQFTPATESLLGDSGLSISLRN